MEKKIKKPTRRQRRRRLIALITVPVVALLAVATVPLWRRHFAKRDVKVLATALRGYAIENGQPPTGSRAQIASSLRGESVGGQNRRKLDYVVASMSEMNAEGEFVDPWGSPYRITAPDSRAYSCGPNRQDEDGNGDDICSWK